MGDNRFDAYIVGNILFFDYRNIALKYSAKH